MDLWPWAFNKIGEATWRSCCLGETKTQGHKTPALPYLLGVGFTIVT